MLQAYMSCTPIDHDGQVGLLYRYTVPTAVEGISEERTASPQLEEITLVTYQYPAKLLVGFWISLQPA